MAHQRAGDFLLSLQASGRYWFTSAELAEAVGGAPVSRAAALRRLRQKTMIATLRSGFHVVVPAEYRAAGSPPAAWFIDALMRHLQHPYYVGLLTAAAIYGAGHQQPQVFQVVTDVPMRAIGRRVHVEFHRNRNLHEVSVRDIKTDTGTMCIATPEATALDIIHLAHAAGQLDNVATVIRELAERMEPSALLQAAAAASRADVQRLGFLLETLGLDTLAEPLAGRVASYRRRPVLLSPGPQGAPVAHDARWFVRPNAMVEPDL